MKSTLKVSISGIAFNLEGDAYQLLKSYLDKLTAHFSKNEGGGEIIEDIEARLAELLLTKISTSEQAVTVNQVSQVIDILGKPEELNDDSITDTKNDGIPYSPSVSAKKRLYRDPDNQVISGVCGGLGVYFNIDPVIFRILFVVITLSGSFMWLLSLNLSAIAVITYVVLWISLPKALTMAQKLEMRGESPSVANIERKMREEAMKSPVQQKPKRNFFSKLVRGGFYTLGVLIAIPVVAVSVGLSIAFIATAFAGGWVLQDSIFPLMDVIALSGVKIGLVKVLALIVLLIPVLLLIYAGIRLLFRFKAKSKGIVISFSTIWVLSVLLLLGMGAYVSRDYRYGAKIATEETIATTSDTVYIGIPHNFNENNTRFYLGWSNIGFSRNGRSVHIPHLWINEQENTISVFPSVDVYYVDDSTFNINYTRSTRARSKGIARQKAGNIPAQYSVTDSLIMLTPHQFTKEHKWSGESGRLVIYAPRGKKVILSDELEDDNDDYY
ncbi:MAG: PspC domain-containing protein [Prevotellaceae bacterium]|jgi:phage shock protein PspC (stress-responsive transcriptional regulator)|nr:PspC domain-containing protein [Prevotellaceae bacterium]